VNATHEEWRPVVGWEGLYEVSDQGRVRSLNRTVACKFGSTKLYKGRTLTGSVNPKTGYRTATLVDAAKGRKKYAVIHRLVLEAFVGPCPPGMECCHGDLDRSNEALSNLRWDTRSANTLDAVRHRTNAHARKDGCAKGHVFDGVTTTGRRGGIRRYCKRCKSDRDRARNQRREQAR